MVRKLIKNAKLRIRKATQAEAKYLIKIVFGGYIWEKKVTNA